MRDSDPLLNHGRDSSSDETDEGDFSCFIPYNLVTQHSIPGNLFSYFLYIILNGFSLCNIVCFICFFKIINVYFFIFSYRQIDSRLC